MSKIEPYFSRGEFLFGSDHSYYVEGFKEAQYKYQELLEDLHNYLGQAHAGELFEQWVEEKGL